jgi:Leucine-rich repeat (LRR) protein
MVSLVTLLYMVSLVTLVYMVLCCHMYSHCALGATDPSLRLLPAVKHLELTHNDIVEVDFMQDCFELQHLDLSYNSIKSMLGINRVLGNIRVLLLGNNRVS